MKVQGILNLRIRKIHAQSCKADRISNQEKNRETKTEKKIVRIQNSGQHSGFTKNN